MTTRKGPIRIVGLFPSLLSTYGDNGNVRILEQRARWRDLPVEVTWIDRGADVPIDHDIYVLGGGEDAPQARAARELRASGALNRAVTGGAVVFAVCAGFQILGHDFPVAGNEPELGLGLLDVTTHRVERPRMVGELVASCPLLGSEPLLGYENHAGATRLHNRAEALGTVTRGSGNGFDDLEGAVAGHVVGTYAHGPALARNPRLADQLLAWALGCEPTQLAPLDDHLHTQLRGERMRALG